jgi:predicted AAA+ superfamily ATPase
MYVQRLLSSTLALALGQFPAVLITGPRQSGKTTFLLHEAAPAGAEYISLDDPLARGFAREDPNGFLDRFGERRVILDEIQYVPELLPYLKLRIDRDRGSYGKWLLTGSQHFQLMKNVSESLAGRIAILELLPFSLAEMGDRTASLASAIWNGGYPEIALAPQKRDLWLSSYVQTYLERDVRQLQNVRDLRTFELFTGVAAARHGQAFNSAAYSRDCGLSLPGVKSWAGVLEASYLSFMLPPYFENYGKRLLKTPKLYFTDAALVCYLTRQPNAEAALAGPMGGALFEGLIVSETRKTFACAGRVPDLYFWRSHDGLEVDLVLRIGGKLYPVEVKLTATPTPRHCEPLNRFRALAGENAGESGFLVCAVKEDTPLPSGNWAISWRSYSDWLRGRLAQLAA